MGVDMKRQRWINAQISGKEIPQNITFDEIEQLINENTISSYVPAHWEHYDDDEEAA
jgi:hypothetical protein